MPSSPSQLDAKPGIPFHVVQDSMEKGGLGCSVNQREAEWRTMKWSESDLPMYIVTLDLNQCVQRVAAQLSHAKA